MLALLITTAATVAITTQNTLDLTRFGSAAEANVLTDQLADQTNIAAPGKQVVTGPGPAYYLITAGGILAALGIIAATFPLLARITGPEVARNE